MPFIRDTKLVPIRSGKSNKHLDLQQRRSRKNAAEYAIKRDGNQNLSGGTEFPRHLSFQTDVRFMASEASFRYVIGGDHAGFGLKSEVILRLQASHVQVLDCGPHTANACDFPDFAEAVAKEILQGRADRGILVCGSGVGVSVAANKFPGIRAAICHDTYSARQGVEHDDMNVLCIGARVIGPEVAFEIVRAFLKARYAPQPRHAARLVKIVDIERRVLENNLGW